MMVRGRPLRAKDLPPVQLRMYTILKDGLPHSREELHGCLWDEEGSIYNIKQHISKLRARLRPLGFDILTQYIHRKMHYRKVRLINKIAEG